MRKLAVACIIIVALAGTILLFRQIARPAPEQVFIDSFAPIDGGLFSNGVFITPSLPVWEKERNKIILKSAAPHTGIYFIGYDQHDDITTAQSAEIAISKDGSWTCTFKNGETAGYYAVDSFERKDKELPLREKTFKEGYIALLPEPEKRKPGDIKHKVAIFAAQAGEVGGKTTLTNGIMLIKFNESMEVKAFEQSSVSVDSGTAHIAFTKVTRFTMTLPTSPQLGEARIMTIEKSSLSTRLP